MTNLKKYLKFRIIEQKPKTNVYSVNNNDNIQIGTIYWYSGWRRYIFESFPEIMIDQACLDEMSRFIGDLMKQRIEERKKLSKIN